MEQKENKKKRVNMWHWNQPEQGMSIEDCEQLVVFSFKNWIIKNSLNALVNWSKFFLPKFTSTKAAISFGDK